MLWLKGTSRSLAMRCHGVSWVRAGDAAATRCVRSAPGSDQALTSAYSFAVLGFGELLKLNSMYRTAARYCSYWHQHREEMGVGGWKGQSQPSRGSALLHSFNHIKVNSDNIGEDGYTETWDEKEKPYH